jgi:flagellar biosynthesis/type III secretory pathway protein FliH
MLTTDAALRERYEARQKALRDHMSLLQDALDEGMEKGREEGREEGIEKGSLMGRIQAYQQVLNRPVMPTEELKTLSIEELRQRAESLTIELVGR